MEVSKLYFFHWSVCSHSTKSLMAVAAEGVFIHAGFCFPKSFRRFLQIDFPPEHYVPMHHFFKKEDLV